MRIQLIPKLTLTALGLASLGLLLFNPGNAAAVNPTTINFQGKIVNANGTNVADNTYTFVFKLYTASSGGAAIWTETDSLATTSGVFQVNLGASCPFFTANACNSSTPIDFSASNSLYLGITFNSDPAGEMSPRVQLQSVPYSFYSDNSGKLGGLTSGNYVQLAQGLQSVNSSSNPLIYLEQNGGSANILQLQSGSTSVLTLGSSGLLSLQPAASLTVSSSALTQTLTNTSSSATSINGISQTITVSNSGSASTTIGANITVTDSTALSLANFNSGVTVTVNGSNASQTQVGVDSLANHGVGIRGQSTGVAGGTITCGGYSTGATGIGVCGGTATASSSAYGGYFVATGNGGTALFATNGTSTANILQLQDGTGPSNVLTVADGGLITLQPATFTGGTSQNAITQTITTNQTANIVNGYSQSITISNASGTTTTNGISISLSDSASGLHNANTGITVSLSGSNTGQIQYGVDTSVSAGVGIRGVSSGNTGAGSTNCFASFSATNFSAGVCGITSSSSAASYGGFFVASANSGTALYASNYTSNSKILDLQNNTSSVFTVASGGLITLQPAAGLTSGQTELAQTFTNGSSTGGTVNGYSQTITVNNTSSASTTNGINIALTDATSLANIDVGLNVDLTGITNSAATKTAASFKGGSVIQTSNGPVYQAGADATSTIGSGTGNEQFNYVVISGNYAYAVKNGDATTCAGSSGSFIGCELQIYDVTNAKKPKYIGGADSTGATNSGTGAVNFNSIFVAGRYAYVVQSSDSTACASTVPNGCEVKVFDISNPKSPTYVGGADTSGTTNSGTDSSQNLTAVFVSGRYLYTGGTQGGGGTCSAAIFNCQIKIWDISNPAAPALISKASEDGTTNGGAAVTATTNSIFVSGRYMYTVSTISSLLQNCSATAGNAIGCELKIWDVTNPANPTYLGGATDAANINSGTNTSGDSINSVYVSGRYAYTASAGFTTNCANGNGSGIGCEIKVWDISVPGTPAYVGGADASGTTSTTGTGAIGDSFTSIYVAGRYAYVSQVGDATACSATVGSGRGCELKVFDVSDPTTPTYLGGADASGSTNTGSGSQTIQSLGVSGRYLYDVSTGNATACSNTPTSGIGCEFQIYDLTGVEATTLSGGSVYAGTIQVASSGQVAGDFNIQGSGTVGQNLQINGNLSDSGQVLFANTANSTTAFQVQNSSGVAILGVDTSGSQVLFGTAGSSGVAGKIVLNTTNASSTNVYITTSSSTGTSYGLTLPTALPGASNYCIVSTNLGALSFSACGAGSTATVVLAPEFTNATFSGVGGTNTGTLTSDYCAGTSRFPSGENTSVCTNATDEHNYYSWTANTGNSYDIFVRWSVPSDFASFSSGSFYYWKTASGDTVTMNVYNNSSTACATQSGSGTTGAWPASPQSITMTGCAPSAGTALTIDIHLAVVGTGSDFARIGEISLTYNRN